MLWRARATLESVVALVAALRAGAVLVPVSPSARGAEVAHVVGDARPVLAICQEPDGADLFGPGVAVVRVEELARESGARTDGHARAAAG